MTEEEFEMQLALGLITLDDLKRFHVSQKVLINNEKIVLKQSCIHLVLIKVNKNGDGNIFRKSVWYPGTILALKTAEIFGWMKRDFSYEPFAGRGQPLYVTKLGREVFDKLQNTDKNHVACPVEINYDALFAFINRSKRHGK